MKEAVARAHALEISDRGLELIHKQADSKVVRKKFDSRVAQTRGLMTVRNVRAKALKHQEDEVDKKAKKAYKKALAGEQKNELASLNAEKKLGQVCS